jgi:hypothetical protein
MLRRTAALNASVHSVRPKIALIDQPHFPASAADHPEAGSVAIGLFLCALCAPLRALRETSSCSTTRLSDQDLRVPPANHFEKLQGDTSTTTAISKESPG